MLAFCSCGGGETGESAENTGAMALFTLVPENPDLVFFFDQEQAEESEIYQELAKIVFAQEESQRAVDTIAERTGIDLVLDVDRIMMAAWFDPESPSEGPERFVVVGRGRFSEDAMARAMEGNEVERKVEDGRVTYLITLAEEKERIALALIDENTVALGEEATVRVATALSAGTGKHLTPESDPIRDSWQQILDKEAWIVLGTDLTTKLDEMADKGMPGRSQADPGRFLRSLQQLETWISFRDVMTLQLSGLCSNEEDATMVAKTIRGLIAMGQLGLQEQNEAYAAWLGDIDVRDEGLRFVVSMQLDLEMLKEIQKARTRYSTPGQ